MNKKEALEESMNIIKKKKKECQSFCVRVLAVFRKICPSIVH